MRVWKFSDDINTDLITPGRLNLSTDPKELAEICFHDYRPEFAKEVREGDIIVAGNNFGCGSSRETAPVAVKASGIRVIIAKYFARIFYRNSINIGLPIVVCEEAVDNIEEGDEVEVDLEKGEIVNKTRDRTFQSTPLPDFVLKIVSSGGILNYLQERGGRFE